MDRAFHLIDVTGAIACATVENRTEARRGSVTRRGQTGDAMGIRLVYPQGRSLRFKEGNDAYDMIHHRS